MTTAAPTATEAVARELVDFCRAGRNLDAVAKLYSPDIVSVETMDYEGMPARSTGIDAIRRKNEWWYDTFEVHSHESEGPYLNGDQFTVKHSYDATNKRTGDHRRSTEIALYTVKNGKVVEERFFHMPT